MEVQRRLSAFYELGWYKLGDKHSTFLTEEARLLCRLKMNWFCALVCILSLRLWMYCVLPFVLSDSLLYCYVYFLASNISILYRLVHMQWCSKSSSWGMVYENSIGILDVGNAHESSVGLNPAVIMHCDTLVSYWCRRQETHRYVALAQKHKHFLMEMTSGVKG